nr:hypothetical protein [Rhizobium sp. ACO-34A]
MSLFDASWSEMSGFLLGMAIMALPGLALIVAAYVAIIRMFLRLWKGFGPERRLSRGLVLLAAFMTLIVLPYALFRSSGDNSQESRIPRPLKMARIEYQLEESWGFGGPGDNETGFVIYQLTEESAGWARAQGSALATQLSQGARCWRPTPVEKDAGTPDDLRRWTGPIQEEREEWAARKPNIADYLDLYGFTIPVEKARMIEADSAIQNPGSFYCYGRGGSLTIVDPGRGKVYFAYAG